MYEKVEREILQNTEKALDIYHEQYVKQREAILELVSELNLYMMEINDHLNELFEMSNNILQDYRNKIASLEQIESIDEETLQNLRKII